jgi:protease IV
MRKFLGTVFIVILVMFFAGCIFSLNGIMGELHMRETKLSKPSILFLELEGVILDGKEFLENLHKYAADDDIKGVLIQINSPGGVVGPSQELFAELKRVRTELKKPVVVSCLGLAASGAYYAAVAADKIVTNPGSLLGSIGVIMEFANLEKLYEWAKIKRYSIKTGQYKDSGAEYREMRPDERLLFQEMANEVLMQFKKTVAESRKLSMEVVDKYADGRVFTGATAVALGFADQVGTLEDAKRLVGQLSGLGSKPEMFTPPPKRPEFLSELFLESKKANSVEAALKDIFHSKFMGQPLYLMPGAQF